MKSSREKADHKDRASEARCKSNYVELEFFKELSTPIGGSLLLYCMSLYKFSHRTKYLLNVRMNE